MVEGPWRLVIPPPTRFDDSKVWKVVVRKPRNLDIGGTVFAEPTSFSHSLIVLFGNFGTNKCRSKGSQEDTKTFKLVRLYKHSLTVSTMFFRAGTDSVLEEGSEVSLVNKASVKSRGFS